MPLLRGRHDDDGTKYQMREKLFAIGDDYWIETDGGERAFKVNGKAIRIRDTFVLETPGGDELFTIQEKKLSVRDKMEIERGGHTVATIKKALVSPLRDRFSIDVQDGEDMEAEGQHRRPRVQDRARRRQGCRGVEEVVPCAGHLRHRDRARPGRRVDPRGRGLHRPDDARRRPTADFSSGGSVRDHSCHEPAYVRPSKPRRCRIVVVRPSAKPM